MESFVELIEYLIEQLIVEAWKQNKFSKLFSNFMEHSMRQPIARIMEQYVEPFVKLIEHSMD